MLQYSLQGVHTFTSSIMMKYYNLAGLLLLLLHLGTLLTSLACPTCPYQTPPPPKLPPKLPPKHPSKPPPKVQEPPPSPPKYPPIVLSPPPPPPYMPEPPIVKPPIVKPPFYPKPPMVMPPHIPKPPIIMPPNVPKTPSPPIVVPTPPIVVPKPPPVETPCPPPPPPPRTTPVLPYPPPSPPKAQQTCPIDTLKLGACVDLLGGLIHVGIGGSAKDTCCPVLDGLVDLDAALCLCTTIKAKLLNVNIILPIALEVLIDCGKTPPPGFQCPS